MNDQTTDDDVRSELARVRALVGPDEESYAKLRADVWGARSEAKAASGELGALRGRVKELERELARARRVERCFEEVALRPLRWLKRVAAKLRRI